MRKQTANLAKSAGAKPAGKPAKGHPVIIIAIGHGKPPKVPRGARKGR